MGQSIKSPLAYVKRGIIEDCPPEAYQFVILKIAFEHAAIKQDFDPSPMHLAIKI